jgi:MFS family permease
MFIVAVLAGMVGYGVMNLVMTATPLVMHEHHYSFSNAAFAVQWHVLGMFVPSFFTPILIERYGLLAVMKCGVALCLLCLLLNLVSLNLWAISLSLVTLGVGWNFLAVSAATLLTHTYAPPERAKTQAINDFLTLATMTITAFSSALLHDRLGWSLVNLSAIPALALIAVAVAWLKALHAPSPEMKITTH